MKLKETIHDYFFEKLLIFLFIFLLAILSHSRLGVDWKEFVENKDQFNKFLSGFMQPEWSYLPKLVKPLFETLYMSITGTILGLALAIPSAFMATSLVTENRFISGFFRIIFGVIRTIPTLLLAAIFVTMVGIGQFTGVLTIMVFTFAMVSQLIFSRIETIEMGPIEADKSIGANKFQVAVDAIWPQINQDVYSYALYAFEVNVRSSAILGYVGAGGIGLLLQTALGFYKYGRASLIIMSILFLVILTDILSYYLREELL